LHESILSESSQDDGQESNLYFSDGHYFQSWKHIDPSERFCAI
jgi:hypothetical protein